MHRRLPAWLLLLALCLGGARAQTNAVPAIDAKFIDFEWIAHLMWRSDLLERQLNGEGVELLCREALLLAPAYEGAVERLARRYERSGEPDLAAMATLYRYSLNTNLGAAVTNQWAERVAELRQRVRVPDTEEERAKRGEEMELLSDLVADDLRNGRLDECEHRLREALRARPADPKILLDLGSVFVRRKEWGMCVMLFDHASRLYPGSADFANNLGTSLAKLERYPAALEVLDRQLIQRPDSPFLLENCGVIASRLRLPARALAYFSKWIEVDPANPTAWLKYGAVLVESGPEKLVFAKVAFRKVLDLDPENRMAMYYLAAIEAMRGKLQDSANWLLRLGPSLGRARLAEILREEPFRDHPQLASVLERLSGPPAAVRGTP